MHVDRHTFRNAMSRFSAAVSVVTTDGPAGRFGFTCTAICAVTDEPATILVCIHKDSRSNAAFKTNLVLCVNLLNRDQEEISAIFAGQAGDDMADRFKRVRWLTRQKTQRGREAFLNGVPAQANPYAGSQYATAAESWLEGWIAAKQEAEKAKQEVNK